MRKPDPLMMMGVLIAMEVIGIYLVANSLWTGRIRFTGHFVERVQDPYLYWIELILFLCGLVVLPLWMLYRERRKR
ncbi:hypothetical protein AU467_08780 [Mesorhizobium loti]|uniref:Uncharacterized protein n=1 Tax=Rhizobium loti TaxID=381 RepID=A0A124GFF6_RHILI|nr:hypothetical protein AU467_08780 [Mesorhizobium loti]